MNPYQWWSKVHDMHALQKNKMAKATRAWQFLQIGVKRISTRNGFDKWFQQSVKFISADDGACIAEMTIGNEHVNDLGHLHGGCTATLVDLVTSAALTTTGSGGISIDLSVSYIKPAKLGEVILMDAKVMRLGRTLAFLTIDLKKKEDGSLVATGKQVKIISAGKGFCVAEMTIGKEHVNSTGNLHGGCTATLVDMVTALALSTTGKDGVSVEINVSYLKAAKLGEVILCDAKAQRVGKTLAFLKLDIKKKDDGSLIATGKHVVFIDRTVATPPPENSP